jgi:hypothetical protein
MTDDDAVKAFTGLAPLHEILTDVLSEIADPRHTCARSPAAPGPQSRRLTEQSLAGVNGREPPCEADRRRSGSQSAGRERGTAIPNADLADIAAAPDRHRRVGCGGLFLCPSPSASDRHRSRLSPLLRAAARGVEPGDSPAAYRAVVSDPWTAADLPDLGGRTVRRHGRQQRNRAGRGTGAGPRRGPRRARRARSAAGSGSRRVDHRVDRGPPARPR